MRMVDLIEKKRDGLQLSKEEIDIVKLNKEIEEIVAREQVLRAEIAKIIAELEG